MATFVKLQSASWRVQVRRKRQYASNRFLRQHDAEECALETERSIDRGVPIKRSRPLDQPKAPADLITLISMIFSKLESQFDDRLQPTWTL